MHKKLFVLFGATGDLSREKLLKSLFSYFLKHTDSFLFLGVSRRPYSLEEFRSFVKDQLSDDPRIPEFLKTIHYVQGTFDEDQTYRKIKEYIEQNTPSRVSAYLAVSPYFFEEIITRGHTEELWGRQFPTRVCIEKPYAHNTREFSNLARIIKTDLGNAAYFVDHYLAKLPVRAIIPFRHEYSEFERFLHRDFVSRVEVYFFEKSDVTGRGEYYDKVGAFIDVGANHMLQMLALLGTELGASKNTCPSKEVFLQSLMVNKNNIKKFQYEGYKDTENIAENSMRETAFEVGFTSRLSRWQDVPFILKGGKGFSENKIGITAYFKDGRKFELSLKPQESLAYKGYKQTYEEAADPYEEIISASFGDNDLCFVTEAEGEAQWRIIEDVEMNWRDVVPARYAKKEKPF